MAERPIIFSAPMVRAILAGTKTQTRRVLKPQPPDRAEHIYRPFACEPNNWQGVNTDAIVIWYGRCPYGESGDRLWVRETFFHEPADYCWEASASIPVRPAITIYRADFQDSELKWYWKPSIHMPRWASRILLEVTDVRVERLQDISEEDAIAEGVNRFPGCSQADDAAAFNRIGPVKNDSFPIARYAVLWEQIYGPGSWDANPLVWVVKFKRTQESNE